MPNKVSLNRSSVGRPQLESRGRDTAEARKRQLPTPGNTRNNRERPEEDKLKKRE